MIKYAILVTNTWTKKESIFPQPFNSKKEVEEKLKELEGKCSVTKGETGSFKNNSYKNICYE